MNNWSFILGAIIAILLIFLGIMLFSPARQLAAEVLGFGDVLLKEDQVQEAQALVKDFVTEYRACKQSADVGCVCPFSSFGLPQGSFIEITNTPASKFTSFKLFRGNVKDPKKVEYGELLSGASIDAYNNPFVENDLIYVPTTTPGRTAGYLNANDEFDLSKYVEGSKIILAKRSSTADGKTPLTFFTSKEFNFRGIFKMDDTRMALIPSPDAVLNIVGGANDREIAKFNQVKRCQLVPDELMQVLIRLKENIMACAGAKRIAPFLCSPFSVDIPKGYQVVMQGNELRLQTGADQKTVTKVALPSAVCHSVVYKDEDLAKVNRDSGQELIFTEQDKAAVGMVLQGQKVCVHKFSEQERLTGAVEILRRTKTTLADTE